MILEEGRTNDVDGGIMMVPMQWVQHDDDDEDDDGNDGDDDYDDDDDDDSPMVPRCWAPRSSPLTLIGHTVAT